MTKAWLRQVIVLCTLHSIKKEVVALMSNSNLSAGKPWESYMNHDPDEWDSLARCQGLCS